MRGERRRARFSKKPGSFLFLSLSLSSSLFLCINPFFSLTLARQRSPPTTRRRRSRSKRPWSCSPPTLRAPEHRRRRQRWCVQRARACRRGCAPGRERPRPWPVAPRTAQSLLPGRPRRGGQQKERVRQQRWRIGVGRRRALDQRQPSTKTRSSGGFAPPPRRSGARRKLLLLLRCASWENLVRRLARGIGVTQAMRCIERVEKSDGIQQRRKKVRKAKNKKTSSLLLSLSFSLSERTFRTFFV